MSDNDNSAIRIGRLDTVGGVAGELGRVYRGMRRDEIDPGLGRALVAALRELRCCLESGSVEARLEAIETLIRGMKK